MKQKNRLRYVCSLLLGILFCAATFLPATAVRAQNTGQIIYSYGEEAIENASIDLYQIGSVDKHGKYQISDEYVAYQVDISSEKAAETLADYIRRDNLQPFQSVLTDAEGKAIFDNLEKALYLVIGENLRTDEYLYIPSPVLVAIPSSNGSSEEWNISIYTKYDREPIIEDTSSIRVAKVWRDSDQTATRPKQIIVQLLKDGEIFDEQELTAENDWKYAWEGMDASAVWKVTEKVVPAGYTVSNYQNQTDFIIVNSKPGTPNRPPVLPQTGMIVLPVLVLLCAGLFLILVGLIIKRKNS